MHDSGSYHHLERRVREMRRRDGREWPDRHRAAFALVLLVWLLIVVLAEPLADLVLRLIG